MKQIIFSFIILVSATVANSKVKTLVSISLPDSAKIMELVIKPYGVDPNKSALLRIKEPKGEITYNIEADEIGKFSVLDFGEILQNGSTNRFADFLAEDGAVVKIEYQNESDRFTFTSTGREQQEVEKMDSLGNAIFKFKELEDAGASDETIEQFYNQYNEWKAQYLRNNPMIDFMFNLATSLTTFYYRDTLLNSNLALYNDVYKNLYPGHSVHKTIADGEKKNYQILGRKYNDYHMYSVDGKEVKASDYFSGRQTVVIFWATWCSPCRREALEAIEILAPFMEKGLNVYSVAREFDNPDNFCKAVKEDNYPWPCFYDLNNKFGVFDMHGMSSSGIMYIDTHGTIVGVPYIEELKELLENKFPNK